MIKITKNSGYHVTFDNGWTVSVQWGPCSYGSNYNCHSPKGVNWIDAEKKAGEKGANTVEIAAWQDSIDDPWLRFGDDDVAPYVSTERVAAVMYYLSRNLPEKAVKSVRA